MSGKESYDPKKKEKVVFHSARDESERKVKKINKPYTSVFGSRYFILGYGIFLFAVITIITMYESGRLKGVVNAFNRKNITSVITKVEYNESDDNMNVTFKIKNASYEKDTIDSVIVVATLFDGGTIVSEERASFDNVPFAKDNIVPITFGFLMSDYEKASKIDFILRLDGKTDIITEHLF